MGQCRATPNPIAFVLGCATSGAVGCGLPSAEARGGRAEAVRKQLKSLATVRPWAKGDEVVERAITFVTNRSQAGRMDDETPVVAKEPIGSGVTEAACEVRVISPRQPIIRS